MPTCRGCGAEIKFIKMAGGSWMPVDPEPVDHDDLEADQSIISEYGTVIRAGYSVQPGTFGYFPHWQSCEKAGQFRRRRV